MVEESEEEFCKVVEGGGKCFPEGIYGDNLMVLSFQCEMFLMRNIERWNLIPRDKVILILTRRENMDA